MKPKQLFFFGVVLLGICFVYACGKSSTNPTEWSCEVELTLESYGAVGYTILSGSGRVELPDLNEIPAAIPSGSASGSGTSITERLAQSAAREMACSQLELPSDLIQQCRRGERVLRVERSRGSIIFYHEGTVKYSYDCQGR